MAVPKPIPGLAFFPGGYGLWVEKRNRRPLGFPNRGVMVLGHDFHSEAGYIASLKRGREAETQPTWLNLLKVFRAAGIPLEKCFFTNFYMGLRRGDGTTGPFPGAMDGDFVKHCEDFFLEQLAAVRPSLIVTLGKYVPPLIASLSSELTSWRRAESFKQIDEAGSVQRGCRFGGVLDFEVTVIAITHPSMRHASLSRRYGTKKGDVDPEVELLKSVVAEIPWLHDSSSAHHRQ